MEQTPSQPNLADLLRRGDPSAGTLLCKHFANRLIALARKRLDKRLRGKVDAEDVLQSAFRSFYRGHAEGQWNIGDEDDLWRLLALITIRKCNRRLEHFLAARRDVRREVGETEAEHSVVDPEPTPEEAAMLADMAETVMNRLGSDIKRQIFELSLQGYNIAEIGERVGYYERGVERVRAEVRALLQAMMEPES